jgi:hypothetical protein
MSRTERIAQLQLALQSDRQEDFVSAVNACIEVGAEGENALLSAYAATSSFDRRFMLVRGLSYFPTERASTFLKGIVGARERNVDDRMLGIAAIGALGRLRREQDSEFLLSLLEDRRAERSNHALVICVFHGTTPAAETSLQFLIRLSRRRTLGRLATPFTDFMVLATLFARSRTDNEELLEQFGTLVRRMWPHLTDLDRRWLGGYWPTATPTWSGPPAAMSSDELEKLARWWETHREKSPKIY